MRKIIAAFMLALLTTSAFFITGMTHDDASGMEPTPGYHDAFLQVNLTLENGTAAVGHALFINGYNPFYPYYSQYIYTDLAGIATTYIPATMWGACRVFAANDSGHYVISEDLYVEPAGVHYLDMQLAEPPAESNTVSGTIRNSTDDSPLEGITVFFSSQDELMNGMFKEETTGSGGSFSFTFPDLLSAFQIIATGPDQYQGQATFTFRPDEDTYTADIWLRPSTPSAGQFSLRFKDAVTGDGLTGDLDVYGYSSDLEHGSVYLSFLTPNGTGWYDLSLGSGEYIADMDVNMGENASIRHHRYFFINSTGGSLDIPVTKPDYIPLTINVMDGSGPIYDASVNYNTYIENGGTQYHGYGYTDAAGRITMNVLSDRPTEFDVYGSGYISRTVTYDPDTQMDSIDILLVLEDDTPYPIAEVEIVPTDIVTGYNLVGEITLITEMGGSYTYSTNETGVFEGEVYAGFYPRVEAVTTMGVGHISNITFVEGTNARTVIPVTRSEQGDPEPPIYSVRIVDEEGAPVRYQAFSVQTENPFTYSAITTDGAGTISFRAGPGSVYISNYIYSNIPSEWSMAWTMLTIDGSGGSLSDITAYRTTPLEEVSGFVRDRDTLEVLPGANINAASFHLLSEEEYPTQNDPMLFQMSHGSSDSGFYRIWGKDDVLIFAEYDGYFPVTEKLEIGSTRGTDHDILLEAVPERDIFVNGTIVDENGDPLQATIDARDDRFPSLEIGSYMTGADGKFSLMLYEGNFTLNFYNDTLYSTLSLEVIEDIDDLILELIPKSYLTVEVQDWSGTPIENLTVEVRKLVGSEYIPNTSARTDGDGFVEFVLGSGTYEFAIGAQMGYAGYVSEAIVLTGWNEESFTVKLDNATFGAISGRVAGDGGPYPGGIPFALIGLYLGNATIANATCDGTGDYRIEEVPFGTYIVIADPPLDLTYEQGARSGYIYLNGTVTIGLGENVFNAVLQYRRMASQEYLNITGMSPTGTGISLDAPIVIDFSFDLDAGTVFGSMITVDPAPGDLAFELSNDGRTLVATHDLFAVNTTYTVTVLPLLKSADGYPMWEISPVVWNFTTGDEVVSWALYSAVVSGVATNKTVTVTAIGKTNLTVFLVVGGIGSFRMDEIAPGSYAVTVPGSQLSYNTSYDYHFSNVTGGPDLAPTLAGTFKTGKELIDDSWSITSATVKVGKDKDWNVIVLGKPNQDVFIVIDGVGSFKLTEVSSGRYETTIPGSQFEWGKDYSYHFSPTSGGPAPVGFGSFSGSVKIGSEPKGETNWSAIGGISCFVILLMVVLIAVIIFFALRRKRGTEE
jgi:hypothetical protein